MTTLSERMSVCQVSISTSDLAGSLRLFENLFGFANAGGSAMWGEAMRVAGLEPSARALVWWMVGSRPFFQLELFEYTNPVPAPLGVGDQIGWAGIGIAVADFDRVLRGLADFGPEPHATVTGSLGSRRIAFRDPFSGITIEAIEATERRGPDVVYATQRVTDIVAAQRLYEETLGVRVELRDPMWRGREAAERSFLAHIGNFTIEVLNCPESGYADGGQRPRRTFDYGIVNVGLGSREGRVAAEVIERLLADGHQTTQITNVGDIVGTYFVDPGCEFEILSLPVELDDVFGYTAGRPLVANMGF
ncbi:catechol 2,3-dioxygenase-like lactoylglutathione lyase family enzyme [Mycolicibacterium sp. BK556]|uniref:VOC family protein n=1 Tax=Mycobacteriaceae TaxID=1762 RepID=UPI001061534B|nr:MULTISPECIES: hypothetical protein [Mycobacteriaceae]MBB3600370.1 catechol 2,3-dioxygenase-like lactoylglutathione lyase family enzyme [Mycolicibacterium sp. BK556]MBB3630122.1 catechol 2,3-dioxygenase-like lactoylglutathione lyase family enzyme [Mycolicibacterium sp. BK607]MBB3748120.1 catechol 2,3-dioxygenase-like lactoylglutathione lyase family enzyme [Mycolicibacterium sp. BK634]TDO09937.1 catechol 2,3-dioxygenase-like lactoylglutathione lyase family enzyme [Mycobacterium sp. BK086]